MKILNLYCCLGGNRYKWSNDHEITAIEIDTDLARMYKERFPNDRVIITDAHEYLLQHYKEYDFIWSSPPCPSHSRARHGRKNLPNFVALYPDLKLYEEILLLKTYFKGKFCVENVRPFYEPLIHGHKRGRHIYWTNFPLPANLGERKHSLMQSIDEFNNWCKFHEIDLTSYKGTQRKDKIARNLVDFEVGKTILDLAMDKKQITKQINLFYEQY